MIFCIDLKMVKQLILHQNQYQMILSSTEKKQDQVSKQFQKQLQKWLPTKFWTFNPALSTLLLVRGSKWEKEKGEWYWLFKVHLCSCLSHELQSAIKSRARAQRTKYYYILYKVLGQVFSYDSMQSINYTCSPHMWGSYDYNQHIHSNIARHTNVFCTHIHFFFSSAIML